MVECVTLARRKWASLEYQVLLDALDVIASFNADASI